MSVYAGRLKYRQGFGKWKSLSKTSTIIGSQPCGEFGVAWFFFKYGKFLLENFIELAKLAGFSYTPAKVDIIFFVGILFYTFQTISYTLDFYF